MSSIGPTGKSAPAKNTLEMTEKLLEHLGRLNADLAPKYNKFGSCVASVR